MEREYFDAKFDGLEKLMRAEKENTLSYIGAVNKKVDRALDALTDHESDPEAHGAAAAGRGSVALVSWLSLGTSVVVAGAMLYPMFHH